MKLALLDVGQWGKDGEFGFADAYSTRFDDLWTNRDGDLLLRFMLWLGFVVRLL
jgi:hypothetical protein